MHSLLPIHHAAALPLALPERQHYKSLLYLQKHMKKLFTNIWKTKTQETTSATQLPLLRPKTKSLLQQITDSIQQSQHLQILNLGIPLPLQLN